MCCKVKENNEKCEIRSRHDKRNQFYQKKNQIEKQEIKKNNYNENVSV